MNVRSILNAPDGSERPSLPAFDFKWHILWQGPFSPIRHGSPIRCSINKHESPTAESIHPKGPIARGSAMNRRTNKGRLSYVRIVMNVRSFPHAPDGSERPSLPAFDSKWHILWQGPFSPIRHGASITRSIKNHHSPPPNPVTQTVRLRVDSP